MNRRRFLRGAGGATLALPWLELFAREARAATTPSRFMVVFRPNGVYPANFFPTPGASPAQFTLNTTCAPLEKWKSKLVFFDGIDMPMAVKGVSPGDEHQRGMGACLTGRKNQAGDIKGVATQSGYADGISLDQELASHIGNTPIRSVHAGVLSEFNSTINKRRMLFSGPGQPLPAVDDPARLFQTIFGGRTPTTTAGGPKNPADVKARSVLDAVLAQLADLEAQSGREDRRRLQQHADFVRSIETRLDTTVLPAAACKFPPAPTGVRPAATADAQKLSRLQIDLLAAAMACNLTRVTTLQYLNSDNQWAFDILPDPANDHSMGHTEWGSTEIGLTTAEGIRRRVPRHLWYATEFAYLMERLSAYQEGDRTLLDNCGVLWMSNLATGGHSYSRMPYVLAGSAGGKVQTGRLLKYTKRSNCDLFVTLLNVFGVEATRFGDPAYCTGALPA